MKKDRKKDVKRAEEKYQKLEEKLADMKRSQRRGSDRFDSPGKQRYTYTTPTYMPHPSTCNYAPP